MKGRSLVTIFLALILIVLVMTVAVLMSFGGWVNSEKVSISTVWEKPYRAAQSMKIINLMGDERDELFIQNAGNISIFSADGQLLFQQDFRPPLVSSLGDVNQDGVDDVLVASFPSNQTEMMVIQSGQIAWQTQITGLGEPARLAMVSFSSGPQIIVGDAQSQMVAFSSDGRELWRAGFFFKQPVRGLDDALVNGQKMLAAASRYGEVYLLDDQGQVLWEYKLPGGLRRLRAYDLNGDGKGEILIGGESGNFEILDAETGSKLVTLPLGQTITEIREAELNGDPGSREVVVGGKEGGVWALTNSGKKIWSASVGDKVTEIASIDLDDDGVQEAVLGDEAGGLSLFNGVDGARTSLDTFSGGVYRLDTGRMTAKDQLAVADEVSLHILTVNPESLPALNYTPLLMGILASLVIAAAAWFIATNPPKPMVQLDIGDQTPEGLRAQRRMLKESIADVERLKAAGEMEANAYLARLKLLRKQLADNEAAMRKLGLKFTPETIVCPHCGGTLPLGTDRCEYCGQVVIS